MKMMKMSTLQNYGLTLDVGKQTVPRSWSFGHFHFPQIKSVGNLLTVCETRESVVRTQPMKQCKYNSVALFCFSHYETKQKTLSTKCTLDKNLSDLALWFSHMALWF